MLIAAFPATVFLISKLFYHDYEKNFMFLSIKMFTGFRVKMNSYFLKLNCAGKGDAFLHLISLNVLDSHEEMCDNKHWMCSILIRPWHKLYISTKLKRIKLRCLDSNTAKFSIISRIIFMKTYLNVSYWFSFLFN